jgi:hypothetical protein
MIPGAALIALMLIALALAPGPAVAAGVDGPGRFYVFRTRDTTQAPTAAQNQACQDYFGPVRAESVVTKLNAALFTFNVDHSTGRVTDQTAAPLGPGFICGAPGVDTGGELDAFAYTALPTTGVVDAHGPCALEPVMAQAGSAIVNCHLQPDPDKSTGVTGGLITSNSVVNESGSAGAPTGSIWTAYIVGAPPARAGHPLPVGPVSGEAAGIDFYVARALGDGKPSGCPAGGQGGSDTLTSVAPSSGSSLIASGLGQRIGHLQVCYTSAIPGGFVADATATVTGAGGPFQIRATGQCDNNATTAGNDQSCALSVTGSTASQVKGGLLTSNGLADPSEPSKRHSAAIWTMALFGAPADAPGRTAPAPAPRRPPRVRLRVPNEPAQVAS